jgi:SAM-dependent methyltransferase
MVVDYTQDQSSLSAQQKLAVQLLQPLLARRRPARILVMKRAGAGDLPLEVANATQVIRLSSGENCDDPVLKCRISALPFEAAAFDLVILHHLVADGSETHLAEALRVLSAGGDIVISGLNSSGLRTRIVNRNQQVPALKMARVCKFLKSQSFNIEQCLLMGMGGFSWPAAKPTWHGLALPFADRVVVHGHHQSKIMNARILRFKQLKSAGRTAATLDGCSSREAAS